MEPFLIDDVYVTDLFRILPDFLAILCSLSLPESLEEVLILSPLFPIKESPNQLSLCLLDELLIGAPRLQVPLILKSVVSLFPLISSRSSPF
jgi:hypothetical protein